MLPAQRLDQYRAIATAALRDLEWEDASTRLLPTTDLTIAGIVKHLAWAEDRWFQGRLLGAKLPAPWDAPGADDPDQAMRLAPGDSRAPAVWRRLVARKGDARVTQPCLALLRPNRRVRTRGDE